MPTDLDIAWVVAQAEEMVSRATTAEDKDRAQRFAAWLRALPLDRAPEPSRTDLESFEPVRIDYAPLAATITDEGVAAEIARIQTDHREMAEAIFRNLARLGIAAGKALSGGLA